MPNVSASFSVDSDPGWGITDGDPFVSWQDIGIQWFGDPIDGQSINGRVVGDHAEAIAGYTQGVINAGAQTDIVAVFKQISGEILVIFSTSDSNNNCTILIQQSGGDDLFIAGQETVAGFSDELFPAFTMARGATSPTEVVITTHLTIAGSSVHLDINGETRDFTVTSPTRSKCGILVTTNPISGVLSRCNSFTVEATDNTSGGPFTYIINEAEDNVGGTLDFTGDLELLTLQTPFELVKEAHLDLEGSLVQEAQTNLTGSLSFNGTLTNQEILLAKGYVFASVIM